MGPSNECLFVGGYVFLDGGNTLTGVASWDGSSWSNVGGGVNCCAFAFATFDPDGNGPSGESLVAAGAFHRAGGLPAGAVAAFDGQAWEPLGSGMQGNSNTVLALAAWDPDGAGPKTPWLCAGGLFSYAGGYLSPYFARWGKVSKTWASGVSGVLDNPSRWYCDEAPVIDERIYIDNTIAGYPDSAFTITLPPGAGAVTAKAWRSRTDNVTLDLNGRSLDLTLPGSDPFGDPTLGIGELPDKPATLIIQNSQPVPAQFSAGSASIGGRATSSPLNNELRVVGPNVDLDLTQYLVVGFEANKGIFRLESGAAAHSQYGL